ncbi:MAG: DUF302 domain-containing protein [Sneathiella sp.]
MRNSSASLIKVGSLIFAVCVVFLSLNKPVLAGDEMKPTQIYKSNLEFSAFLVELKAAIKQEKMGVIAEACADCGARSIGVEIPGNRVVMIFNPHFAVRMLKANVEAGVEAPLRLYVIETASGSQLSYRKPSDVFAPYSSSGDLAKMAKELDLILERIAKSATQ